MAAQVETMPARSKREGSPWTGLWAVVGKEMADHLTSARMRILDILIILTAFGTVYAAIRTLREASAIDDRFLLLNLFTTSQDPIPAFTAFLAFLIPLTAIALTFDAINAEFMGRTMSRLLAQPIYRDALLLGKFLGALFTLSLVLTAIWLLIIGLGIIGLGVPPSGEEFARSMLFLLASICYGAVWLSLALLFSIVFRQPATAAMASIASWLFFTVFWSMISSAVVQAVRPIRYGLAQEILARAELALAFGRLSPNTLYSEVEMAVLHPAVRSLGLVLPFQYEGAIPGAPLPLDESVQLIWPHLVGLIALTILLFTIGYVLFQRREIRA
ncbi:MAG: ABC transporter permease [Caldilineales bacterium]|nr:ABC transporter permease [Caldilineales bacterium]